jgi:hypothetical protein
VNEIAEKLSVMKQVALGLAAAECSPIRFEHRDCHGGNILLERLGGERKKAFARRVYALGPEGDKMEVETEGILVKIIDFSFSRATIG